MGSKTVGRFLPRTLYAQVASRLGARIVRGDWSPGTILPNEASLGAELGVSRTVLREVIKVLAAKSLIEVRPKTGTRIRPTGDWNMLDPDVLDWQSSGSPALDYLEDLLEVRRIIEPVAARMAAKRARPKDLEEIEQVCLEMKDAADDAEASIDPDLRFHLAILGATYNIFMPSFGALIQAALRASFRLTNANPASYRRSLKQHRAVLDAIRARNPNRAEAAMRDLLARTSDDVHEVLKIEGLQTGKPCPSRRLETRKSKS